MNSFIISKLNKQYAFFHFKYLKIEMKKKLIWISAIVL